MKFLNRLFYSIAIIPTVLITWPVWLLTGVNLAYNLEEWSYKNL